MSFFILQNSTTADASHVNADFLHIAQNNVLPKIASGNMASTNNSYNLGSTATTWKTLYCDNLYNNSITNLGNSWALLGRVNLTTTATSIEFRDDTGGFNDYDQYFLIYNFLTKATAGAIQLKLSYLDTTTTSVPWGSADWDYSQGSGTSSLRTSYQYQLPSLWATSTGRYNMGKIITTIFRNEKVLFSDGEFFHGYDGDLQKYTGIQSMAVSVKITTTIYVVNLSVTGAYVIEPKSWIELYGR
jgi:hypothetical protein